MIWVTVSYNECQCQCQSWIYIGLAHTRKASNAPLMKHSISAFVPVITGDLISSDIIAFWSVAYSGGGVVGVHPPHDRTDENFHML